MATMVKEKRREKKKTKEKSKALDSVTEETLRIVPESMAVEDNSTTSIERDNKDHAEQTGTCSTYTNQSDKLETICTLSQNLAEDIQINNNLSANSSENCMFIQSNTVKPIECNQIDGLADRSRLESTKEDQQVTSVDFTSYKTVSVKYAKKKSDNYEHLNLNKRIQEIALSEARVLEVSDSNMHVSECGPYIHETESAVPSAPVFEEEIQPQIQYEQVPIQETKPKWQCMPLEEAVNIFGGTEIAAVKKMSEKEEAIVEAGPVSGPEHPLVDLLSTFKSSLRALENERSRLTCSCADEDKYRSTLWKVEKRNIYQKKQCKCGASVELRATYEYAQLLKERMPVARLKLESLLRDIQDCYCHHQHAALLAHCQIEELISETIDSSKPAIREALSLVLQALRVSDESVAALPAALQRWAAALVAALVDERDVTHLLFVVHHLFRQSRSVGWATRALRPRVPDAVAAARALAVIDTLLASPRLDAALECIEEDADEGWEEVSVRGAGGAVSEGALREIDLLALLHAFPLRDLVARILMFTHADIRQARSYEWGDARGGCDVMTACCGVRALLATLRRASAAHAQYARLLRKLRLLATTALDGLSCFYRSPRAPYVLQEKIQAELEACFVAGFNLFGTRELHKLDTMLLADTTAKDYCLTYMIGLHDTTPREVDSMLIYAPVLPCSVRVRILSCAAQRRPGDHELARIVLDFLLQTGGKVDSPPASCKGGCGVAARAQLALLLTAHPYLRTTALHAVADLAQVSSLDPSLVGSLRVGEWRPQCEEMQAVLHDWAQRCPQLLHQLLLQLDCTPFTGLSLPVQLTVGAWLCEWQRSKPADSELCWRVLLRLRTHRSCWRLPPDAPAPDPEPSDLFSNAHALLTSSWGHSIPLICSHGVEALCALGVRARTQAHCLAPVMLLMAHSPDSVSLTPRFTELFTSILSGGPTLVQRAFGRGGVPGSELLLRLLLAQLDDERRDSGSRVSVFPAWLHALWRVPLRAAAAALDTAALATRKWPALDAHAAILLQDDNAKEHLAFAVRNASIAPLLCECLLRASHNRELSTQMFGALANILWEQRVNGHKIHVDNALQKINAGISSEELVIYRCANAALVAPLQHPSHLTLWRLFFHLYLQRPPNNMRDTALPVGPLFFSGLIKSRTLAQLVKRLQETAAHHRTEAETYKKTQPSQLSSNRVVKSSSITIEKELLPALSIKDLTGESSDASNCDSDLSEESEEECDVEEKEMVDDTSEADKKHAFNMSCYHTAAERMVREFCGWLEDNDHVRASPHHADIARFMPEQALEAAWQDSLSRSRPPPSEELDDFPRPATAQHSPPERENSPLDVAVRSIMKIKDRSGIRSQRIIKSPLDDVDVKNPNKLCEAVDSYLRSIDAFATEWAGEVNRISSLDRRVWELVVTLRVPRPLPPVTVPCPAAHTNKCKPTLFYIQEREWCISTGAERAINENRSSWVQAVRGLTRARPAAARTAAALHSIARRVRDKASGAGACERVWLAAGAQCAHCPAARAALQAALQELAERWIQHDAEVVVALLSRWCAARCSPLQQALCGALVAPRRLPADAWPRVYTTLLHSTATLPSHAVFSYLSKFEMSQWSRTAAPAARRELLSALVAAQARHGAAPAPEHSVLLELLGIHTAAVLNSDEMCAVVMQFATLAADGKLPPRQWTHLVSAVGAASERLTFDRVVQVLCELGAVWWRARALYNGAATLVPHAEYVAAVLTRLARALVAHACALSYHPERVGRCAWSAVQESWSAWVAPHPDTPPLLPSLAATDGDGEYCLMLHRFLACLQDVMADCPGSEVAILQSVFEWTCACHAACRGGKRREGRVQASELQAALAHLPWADHQWFTGSCLHVATQMCASTDCEIMSWCCAVWARTDAATLLRDVTDDALAARLAAVLYLFTGAPLPHAQHILGEAARLPWRRLPEPALGEALDRFFMSHHDPTQAYHDFPQFQVLLHASLLRVHATECDRAGESRDKRARCVSAWSRAAAAPALHPHCAGHARAVLHTLADLAPYLEESSGELEELLGRASVIMCMEPAAAAALPVWQKWVAGASVRAQLTCVTAAAALTAPAYCALLADTAILAYLTASESSWSEVVRRWRGASPWREAREFVSRACLHAAYACARAAQPPPPQRARPPLHALLAVTPNIDFVANEAMVAVWICYACGAALGSAAGAPEGQEAPGECGEAAAALLRAWAQPPRRSLLKVVTLQSDTNRSTARHRVLCRMAECILAPSAEAAQAYELACVAAGGCDDVMSWGRAPHPARLPRLAAALYPALERYFTLELQDTAATG